MSTACLIIGDPGTGKSTSIEHLDPEETFIIAVMNKPLPFKGGKKNYIQKENGNYFASDYQPNILKVMKQVNERPHIKTLIIDDYQYVMGNEFMRRSLEKGFDKFTQISQLAWEVAKLSSELRGDLDCFLLSHSQETEGGKYKCKTIGKMLDEKISLEGMFTVILHSLVVNEGKECKFLTNHDGIHIAKSPKGMFKDRLIDNDLLFVKQEMNKYFNEDIPQ